MEDYYYPVGGNHQFSYSFPQDAMPMTHFQYAPAGISTQWDPYYSYGYTHYSTTAGDLTEAAVAAGQSQPVLYPYGRHAAEIPHQQPAHTAEAYWAWFNPGLTQYHYHQAPCFVQDPGSSSSFMATVGLEISPLQVNGGAPSMWQPAAPHHLAAVGAEMLHPEMGLWPEANPGDGLRRLTHQPRLPYNSHSAGDAVAGPFVGSSILHSGSPTPLPPFRVADFDMRELEDAALTATAAGAAEILHEQQHAHPELDDWQEAEELLHSVLDFDMREDNDAALNATPAANAEEVLPAENARREPAPPEANAGLIQPEPYSPTPNVEEIVPVVENTRPEPAPPLVNAGLVQPVPCSGKDTSPSTTADTGPGIISSPDLEVNAAAGLPQPGPCGGASKEASVQEESSKRKRRNCSSTGHRSSPEFRALEEFLPRSLLVPEPTTDIRLPASSTDREKLQFLMGESSKLRRRRQEVVNISLADEDQTAPVANRSYVTTNRLEPELKTPQGYWKQEDCVFVQEGESSDKPLTVPLWGSDIIGMKKTCRFHTSNGKGTNYFMYEYIATGHWGRDLYFVDLYYREVFIRAGEVQGEPASAQDGKTKIAVVKHRMRGLGDPMVLGRESRAWQYFIKVYDKHPELEGSKVVYAVCCYCDGVLKADTKNGTNSLLTHCDRTCPCKHKQASSSSLHQAG